MTSIELLAPAKDLACGQAAIDCGADAIYIGAPRFGAREQVGNSLEDIAALAQYAHTFWAKVYVTLNTLLFDHEIPPAVELTHRLYEIGIDGLIIQDMGLLECDLPPIHLIASTQVHNHTPEKVAFLERVGFRRAILARELDLEQIQRIREAAPTIELECFIHGALCVCYSGQCYLSYALGGRSGNRGQCAQPCRKPYRLQDHHGQAIQPRRHWLSLQDMNLTDHLQPLLEAGITSFKIEGRLKDQAYVTNIVSHYREQLDHLLPEMNLQRSSAGNSWADFTPDPAKTFNRGFTSYFLQGKGNSVASVETPKMKGEFIGRVMQSSPQGFRLETKFELHPGDGLCWFDEQGELQGATVNGLKQGLIIPHKALSLRKGTSVYRNHDHEFLTCLQKSRVERKIAILMALTATETHLELAVQDEQDIRSTYTMPFAAQLAENPEQVRTAIQRQLSKTGDTEFQCANIEMENSQVYFLPISVLNTLRREALQNHRQLRENLRTRGETFIRPSDVPYPEASLTYLGNVLNQKARAFYRRHGVHPIESGAETGMDLAGRRVMTTRYCVRREIQQCPQETSGATSSALFLVDDDGSRLELRFDCRRCEMHIVFHTK